jgi:hypothetical protein
LLASISASTSFSDFLLNCQVKAHGKCHQVSSSTPSS